MARLISSTPRASLDALRHQGILVTESYAQIRSALEKALSSRHASFFAEPAHESAGGSIDWYTDAEGEITPLQSIPQENQTAARKEISALAEDIRRHADELVQTGDPAKTIRGNILRLALEYPGTDYLYMVGNQPVLTGWGLHAAGSTAKPEDLIRLGAALPAVSAVSTPMSPQQNLPTAPVRPKKSFWWLRALFSLLLGLLLLLGLFWLAALLLGTGINIGGCTVPGLTNGTQRYFTGCTREPEVVTPKVTTIPPEVLGRIREDQDKEEGLRRRIEELRLQLMQKLAQCPRPVIEIPVEQIPIEPLQDDEIPDIADLMPLTPEPEPEVIPQPKKVTPQETKKETPVKQKKGDDLSIPPEAQKKNDLSFLEGCWNSETDLFSSNNEKVTVEYCFDNKGNGKRVVTEPRTRNKCTGPVRARFNGSGGLVMQADSASCARGGGYVPHRVNCQQSGNKAQCYGQEQGKNRNQWEARFKKQ